MSKIIQLDFSECRICCFFKEYFSKLIDEVLKPINRSLLKLLDGLTSETYSHEYEFKDLQPFPSVTFCPFFRVYEDYESFSEADRNTPLMPNFIFDFDHKFSDKYIIIVLCNFCCTVGDILTSQCRNVTKRDFNDSTIFVQNITTSINHINRCFTYNPPKLSIVGFDRGRVSVLFLNSG